MWRSAITSWVLVMAAVGCTSDRTDVDPQVSGVPRMVTDDQGNSVVVAPGRPGWNLVHATASSLTTSVDGRATEASARPGADGLWARIWLDEGPQSVEVVLEGTRTRVPLDAGNRSGAAVAGPDGPECVATAVGSLVADRTEPLQECPSAALAAGERRLLEDGLRQLSDTGSARISLFSDDSPRGRQARQVVARRAAELGLHVGPPTTDASAVIVGGWASAAGVLTRITRGRVPARGTVLAPWLLTAPLLRDPIDHLVPLGFDPSEGEPARYAATLSHRFGGAPASPAGLAGFAHGSLFARGTRLYTASTVSVPGMNLPRAVSGAGAAAGGTHHAADDGPEAHDHTTSTGRWFPGGSTVAVTDALEGAPG